jgi:hypothetical protein
MTQKVAKSIICDSCGSTYDIIYESTPYDENDIAYCSFCGDELEVYNDDSEDDEDVEDEYQ